MKMTCSALAVSIIILFACKKKNLRLPPTITTTAVSNITDSTAVSGGAFTSIGNLSISADGMQWDTLASFAGGGYTSVDGAGTSNYASILTLLRPATTYYVRAYAIAAKDTVYGNVLQFTTAL